MSSAASVYDILAGRLLKTRWHTFSATLLAASISGTSYAFGMFSEVFKDRLGYSQLELSVIGSCGSTGLYTGVFCGLLIERHGPRAVLLSGAGLIFCGNMYMWLAAQKSVPHSVPVLALFNFIAQVGIACSSSTATTVSIRSFPSEIRGRVAGLAKAYFGVSSAVLATIASGFFPSASVNFILFVAIMLPTFLIFSALNMNRSFLSADLVSFDYERQKGYRTTVIPYFVHIVILFMFILVVSAVTHFVKSVGSNVEYALSTLVALYICAIMLLPSMYGPRVIHLDASEEAALSPLLVSEGNTNQLKKTDLFEQEQRSVNFISFYGRHLTVTEIMKEWRCYLLMFVFCCTAGSGLFVINNIVAVCATVGQDASAFFVVLISLANGTGRIAVGVMGDKLSETLSRLQLLAITSVIMAIAQFLLSLTTHELLYPSLFIVGLPFGATFSNISAIVADLFGSRHIGSNYGFIDLSPTIGSYAFSTGLIALFYPRSSEGDDGDDDEGSCEGAHCLQSAFFVTSGVCLAAGLAALILHFQTPMNNNASS